MHLTPNTGRALPLTCSVKGAGLSLICPLIVKWRAAAVSRRTQGLVKSVAVARGLDGVAGKILFAVNRSKYDSFS